jgi:hypothetical protein
MRISKAEKPKCPIRPENMDESSSAKALPIHFRNTLGIIRNFSSAPVLRAMDCYLEFAQAAPGLISTLELQDATLEHRRALRPRLRRALQLFPILPAS